MKRSKIFSKLLSYLIIFGMLIAAFPTTSYGQTNILVYGETSSDNLLQDGGLLEDDSVSTYRSANLYKSSNLVADTTGARQALRTCWENIESECDISSYNIPYSDLQNFYFGFLNECPEYFYVSNLVSYSCNPSTGTLSTITIQYDSSDISDIKARKTAFDQTLNAICSKADSNWSDLEKALYINDYLCETCSYDTTHKNHDAYDALVTRSAVCQGYALAYELIADKLDLACELVTSESLNHAWNVVKVNGNYYYVDSTWDDPTADLLGRVRHYYLLKSETFFQDSSKGNHVASDYVFSGSVSNSDVSDTGYDDYFWNSSDSAFQYYNGYWYGYNGENYIYKYQCENNKLNGISSIRNVSSDIWKVWNDDSQYWTKKYISLKIYNKKLYINTYSDILSYDLSDASPTSSTICSLSSLSITDGYIYGFTIDSDGYINLAISQSPNITATNKLKVQQISHTHTYSSPAFTWDGATASATFTCSICTGTISEACSISTNITKQATCALAGSKKYTASITKDGVTYTDTITESIPATGNHIYGSPAFSWTGYSSATATFTCTACSASTEKACTITDTIVTQPTCGASGTRKYTASVIFKDVTYTSEKNETLAATGTHQYDSGLVTKQPTQTEEGVKTFTCTVCGAQTTEAIEKLPSDSDSSPSDNSGSSSSDNSGSSSSDNSGANTDNTDNTTNPADSNNDSNDQSTAEEEKVELYLYVKKGSKTVSSVNVAKKKKLVLTVSTNSKDKVSLKSQSAKNKKIATVSYKNGKLTIKAKKKGKIKITLVSRKLSRVITIKVK